MISKKNGQNLLGCHASLSVSLKSPLLSYCAENKYFHFLYQSYLQICRQMIVKFLSENSSRNLNYKLSLSLLFCAYSLSVSLSLSLSLSLPLSLSLSLSLSPCCCLARHLQLTRLLLIVISTGTFNSKNIYFVTYV